MATDGFTAFNYGNAARSGSALVDSQVGTPGTGIDTLMNVLLTGYINNNPNTVTHVLMNWGANDMENTLVEATWVSQYGALISYCHTRFPNAKFYLSYPWRRGYDSQAATLHGWINTVIANANAAGIVTFAGVDEAVTIKAGDDGATNTDFGVHYSAAGAAAYAAAMKTILGY